MAQKTYTRLYDRYEDAATVVSNLETAGVPHSDISIVSNDSTHRTAMATDSTVAHENGAANGAGAGATLGTVVGGGAGLLAGIGALAIPGVGPVVAAGWLIATLAGAGVGAAAGGVLGSLTGAGVSEPEAHVYAEGLRRGGTLVTVRTDDAMNAKIEQILDSGNAVDWNARGKEYRSAGWTRYDENAAIASGAVPPVMEDGRPVGPRPVAPLSDPELQRMR
jgi:hypothetical protein